MSSKSSNGKKAPKPPKGGGPKSGSKSKPAAPQQPPSEPRQGSAASKTGDKSLTRFDMVRKLVRGRTVFAYPPGELGIASSIRATGVIPYEDAGANSHADAANVRDQLLTAFVHCVRDHIPSVDETTIRIVVLGPGSHEVAKLTKLLEKEYGASNGPLASRKFDVRGMREKLTESDLVRGRPLLHVPLDWHPHGIWGRDVYIPLPEWRAMLVAKGWKPVFEYYALKHFNYRPNSLHFHSVKTHNWPALVVDDVEVHPALPGGVVYQGYTKVLADGSVEYRPEPSGAVYQHQQNGYLFNRSNITIDCYGVNLQVSWHVHRVMPDGFNHLITMRHQVAPTCTSGMTEIEEWKPHGEPYLRATIEDEVLTDALPIMRMRAAGLNPNSVDNVTRLPVYLHDAAEPLREALLKRYRLVPGIEDILQDAVDGAALAVWDTPLPAVPTVAYDNCLRANTAEHLATHLSEKTHLSEDAASIWGKFRRSKGVYDRVEVVLEALSMGCDWVLAFLRKIKDWLVLTFGSKKGERVYPVVNPGSDALSDRQLSMVQSLLDMVTAWSPTTITKMWNALVSCTPQRMLDLLAKPLRERYVIMSADITMAVASGILEEVVKRAFPGAGLVFGLVETAIRAMTRFRSGTLLTWEFLGESTFRLIAHAGLSLLPFGLAAGIHALFNVVNVLAFGGAFERMAAATAQADLILERISLVEKEMMEVRMAEQELPASETVMQEDQIPTGVMVRLEPGMLPVPVTKRLVDYWNVVHEHPESRTYAMAHDAGIESHGKPVNSAVEILSMIKTRLQVSVTRTRAQRLAFQEQLQYLRVAFQLAPMKGKSWEEFREWVKEKFTGSKRQVYLEDLDAVEGLVLPVFKSRVASVKTDEALILRYTTTPEALRIALDAGGHTKTRPLAMRMVQDLAGMMFADGFKDTLAVMFVFDGPQRVVRRYGEELYQPTTSCCVIIFYAARVNSVILGEVATHCRKYAILLHLIHGDDSQFLFNYRKGSLLVSQSSASDLGSCDLTVGMGAHQEMMDFAQKLGYPRDAAAAHLKSCHGVRQAETKVPWPMMIQWFVSEAEGHTLTGVPLTAIMAAGANLVPSVETARHFCDSGWPAPEELALRWTTHYNALLTRNGHKVEPELNALDGGIIHPLSGTTFLGQFAILSGDQVHYREISQVKILKVRTAAYASTTAKALPMWAYAASQQPGLNGTEHAIALKHLLLRTLVHWNGGELSARERRHALSVHESIKGQYMRDVEGDYTLEMVPEVDYLNALTLLGTSRGVHDVVARVQRSKDLIDGAKALPLESTLGLDVFFELRYGKLAKSELSLELNLASTILDWSLGWLGLLRKYDIDMSNKAKDVRKQAKQQNSGSGRSALLKAASKVPKSLPPALGQQLSHLSEPLTHQDEAVLGYLHTIADPFTSHPVGVPLVLGSGGVITLKAALKRTVTMRAGSAGYGFVSMNADGWIGDADGDVGVPTFRYARPNGFTGGSNLWYSDSNWAGSAFPGQGTTTATTGVLASSCPLIDDSITPNANYRMIGMGLRVVPDDADLTQKGTIYVVSTAEPYGVPAEGAIQGMTEAQLTAENAEIISVETGSVSKWPSNKHFMVTAAIPSDAACFRFTSANGVTRTTFDFPQIGVFVSGAAVGQAFKVHTVMLYEYEKTQTNTIGDTTEPAAVGGDLLVSGLAQMNRLGASMGPTTVHSNGTANTTGVKAFANALAVTRPLKLPSLAMEIKKPSFGWGDAAKSALGLGSRILSQLPGIGGFLGKGAALLSSIF